MTHSLTDISRLIASGQAQAAEKILEQEIKKENPPGKIHSLYAQSLFAQGNVSDAIAYLDQLQATIKQPDPQLYADLGEMLLRNQQYEQAEHHFKEAIKQVPSSDQLWHILGISQYRSGKKQEALESFAKSEQFDRFLPQIQIAEKAMDSNERNTFINTVEQILKAMPVHPKAAWLKASWLMQEGQTEQAASQLAPALNYAPYNEALLDLMVLIQVQLCDLEAALNTTAMLLEIAPNKHKYWSVKGDIQQNIGQLEAAIESFEKAIELGASPTTTQLQIAYQQKSLGRNQEAIASFRQCLSDKDCVGSAMWGLSTLSEYEATTEEKRKLEESQWDTTLSAEQACQASFSLARQAEKAGNYEEAFSHYENANNLKPGIRYSPQKIDKKFAAIKSTFSNDFLSITGCESVDEQQPTPIFITGLPRTGSTLTEQILATHTQVEGTMELKVMPAVTRRALLVSNQRSGKNDGDLSCLTDRDFKDLGNYYLHLSKVYRTDAPYFIDKLPPNYQHIGLIHKILPGAIIIDTRREPMAWGMAVYRQYFAQGHDFIYDFSQIAHAYNNYLDLMTHWNVCLPGKIYLMEYEKLVANKEEQIKALLQHCGLDFEEQCLTPHLHNRYVKTASSDQVRKPIYKTSVSSWKNYEPFLSKLKQAF